MERNNYFEINLNHIMTFELMNGRQLSDSLKDIALHLLMRKGIFTLLEDNLKDKKCKTEEEFKANYGDQYKVVPVKNKKDGKFVRAVFDLYEAYDIQIDDIGYDMFFTYRVRNLDLMQIDSFLEFQLEEYYQNDFSSFKRFIELCIRKYGTELLEEKTIDTLKEWIENSCNSLAGTKKSITAKWTGDKVDFMKLVYALYTSKNLNNGEGSILKIMSSLSDFLGAGYTSGDNDVSVSIGAANNDQKSLFSFFDEIKAGFSSYMDGLKKKKT